jgi:hypothetical protein
LNRCETAARSAAVLRKRAVTNTLLQVLCPEPSEMSEKKALPAKLEEDLASAKFYKPSSAGQETTAEKMAKVFDDSKERAMYDEILGPMLGNRGSKPVTAPKPSVTAGSDFNTSIITRLKQVEMEAKDMRMRLAEQIAINEKIIAENALLKSMVDNPDSATREVGSLRRQVTQLKVKIVEMETFLGDYGLVWVGNNKPNIADDTCADVEPEPEDAMRHTVNFADFNMQIDELNAVIYSEPAQIVKEGANNRKARLVQSSELLETVRIVFYQNGLMIKRGPFRYCNKLIQQHQLHKAAVNAMAKPVEALTTAAAQHLSVPVAGTAQPGGSSLHATSAPAASSGGTVLPTTAGKTISEHAVPSSSGANGAQSARAAASSSEMNPKPASESAPAATAARDAPAQEVGSQVVSSSVSTPRIEVTLPPSTTQQAWHDSYRDPQMRIEVIKNMVLKCRHYEEHKEDLAWLRERNTYCTTLEQVLYTQAVTRQQYTHAIAEAVREGLV